MSSRDATVFAVVLAFGALLHAARQQPPEFKGGADFVEVDATVVGADGHLITDLSVDDFVLSEDGQPQPIRTFYVVHGSQVAPATPGAGGAPTSVPTSGRNLTADHLRRVYVVVFDSFHLWNDGYKRTKLAARTLFEKHFEDGDIGCVVSNGQIVNGRMTSDREELLKAVDSVQPVALAIRGFDLFLEYSKWADDMVGVSKDAAAADEARLNTLTVATLSELMDTLKGVEGRKTVLLMSSGFGSPQLGTHRKDSDFGLLRSAVGVAQSANARVYGIDARGLVGGINNTLMDILAVDTGGYVVRNENRLDNSIANIAAEATTYYVLGYTRPGSADHTFRSIDVKVKRSGATVRARKGYIAAP